jgi:hypothetical protein
MNCPTHSQGLRDVQKFKRSGSQRCLYLSLGISHRSKPQISMSCTMELAWQLRTRGSGLCVLMLMRTQTKSTCVQSFVWHARSCKIAVAVKRNQQGESGMQTKLWAEQPFEWALRADVDHPATAIQLSHDHNKSVFIRWRQSTPLNRWTEGPEQSAQQIVYCPNED